MPGLSLYKRGKNGDGWKYERIEEGRGHRTGDLSGPFYARPFFNGKQLWKTLSAETFAEARAEADNLTAALEARTKGLTVAELEEISNANRIPLKQAVEDFLSEALKTKKKKTLLGYRLNLSQSLESTKIRFLDEVTKKTICDFRNYHSANAYEAATLHNQIITDLSLSRVPSTQHDFSLPTY